MDPEASGLWSSIRFALPSYGVRCVHSILRSTLEGPISRELVESWARDVVNREGAQARSFGLWCSYSKCVLLVESCDPGFTVLVPSRLPGRLSGTVPRGGRYGVAFDREDGSFGAYRLPASKTGRFSFLVPPCRKGMAFMDVDFYEDLGDRVRPVATVRMPCGARLYPRIMDPLSLPSVSDVSQAEKLLFGMVNHFRRLKGLSPLRWDDRLARAARSHSRVLCRLGELYHERPDGSTPYSRARQAGYPGPVVAENLALTVRIQVTALGWYESYPHRGTMQDPELEDAGIGICERPQDGYTYLYATLLAGSTSPASPRHTKGSTFPP